MGKKSSTTCVVVAVVIGAIACLSLVGVDIWRSNVLNAALMLKVGQLELAVNVSVTDPFIVFRNFYYAPGEKDRIMGQVKKNFATEQITSERKDCTFSCPGNSSTTPGPGGRRKRSDDGSHIYSHMTDGESRVHKRQAPAPIAVGDQIFHGCCQSALVIVKPEYAVDVNGANRRVVQNLGMGFEQGFYSETCLHLDPVGCTGCTCGQPEPFIFEAVVYKGSSIAFDATGMEAVHISVNGSCKCLNLV